MTLKEELKKQKEAFWKEKEGMLKTAVDKMGNEMKRYQERFACYYNKYFIEIVMRYDDCGAASSGINARYHGTERVMCRIGYMESSLNHEFELISFPHCSNLFGERLLKLLAERLEEQGFSNVKKFNTNSNFTAELDLK